uniref:Uncharacterized protein n=1 Tax=Tetranychus urticae TaxID=32264 RepID=T1KJQ0_TETUR
MLWTFNLDGIGLSKVSIVIFAINLNGIVIYDWKYISLFDGLNDRLQEEQVTSGQAIHGEGKVTCKVWNL